jgi:hypothetical protein
MDNGGDDKYVGKLVLGIIVLLAVNFVLIALAGITGSWLFIVLAVVSVIGGVLYLTRQ